MGLIVLMSGDVNIFTRFRT